MSEFTMSPAQILTEAARLIKENDEANRESMLPIWRATVEVWYRDLGLPNEVSGWMEKQYYDLATATNKEILDKAVELLTEGYCYNKKNCDDMYSLGKQWSSFWYDIEDVLPDEIQDKLRTADSCIEHFRYMCNSVGGKR